MESELLAGDCEVVDSLLEGLFEEESLLKLFWLLPSEPEKINLSPTTITTKTIMIMEKSIWISGK